MMIATAIWDGLADGGLVKALGGATNQEVAALAAVTVSPEDWSCKTLVSEDEEQFRQCAEPQFELTRWCSGNCDNDDARAVICCTKPSAE